MVCEEVRVTGSGLVDLPNVVVDGVTSTVEICGSKRWHKMEGLPEVFVCIFSHESIHQVLGGMGQKTAEALDDVASLSVISRTLNDIGLCSRYPHGLIGFDGFGEK